jgi:hypothetical protein
MKPFFQIQSTTPVNIRQSSSSSSTAVRTFFSGEPSINLLHISRFSQIIMRDFLPEILILQPFFLLQTNHTSSCTKSLPPWPARAPPHTLNTPPSRHEEQPTQVVPSLHGNKERKKKVPTIDLIY